MVEQAGTKSGAYRDLNLAFINFDGKPTRCLDLLNAARANTQPLLHNADFISPTILYLGSYLNKRNITFDYINLFQQEKNRLKELLLNEEILTIAITTTMYVTVYPILDIISFIRKYNNKAKIIVGGPFIFSRFMGSSPEAMQTIFEYINADIYVVNAEGEQALVNIINGIKNKHTLHNIDNIAYPDQSQFTITKQVKEDNSISNEKINYTLFSKKAFNEFVSLRTTKSCPFSCAYCSFHIRSGKYTYMSTERVEEELDAIRDIGNVTTLNFFDDTFNVPKERFKLILKMMIRNNYGFKWAMHYRCDFGDAETISLMKDAGCEGVFLGIESGSDEMLTIMNKTARKKDYYKAIPELKKADIWTHANFIIGFPGETTSSINETKKLIEDLQPNTYRAQMWYADPITPIFAKKENYAIKGSAFNWQHSTMNANTAADWVDHLFTNINNSTWLPQFGFELWSVFYLQRHGLTKTQVKEFISYFNGLVKKKLHGDTKLPTTNQIMRKLKNITDILTAQ